MPQWLMFVHLLGRSLVLTYPVGLCPVKVALLPLSLNPEGNGEREPVRE